MTDAGEGCGPLYELYSAARAADSDAMAAAWSRIQPRALGLDPGRVRRLERAIEAGEADTVRATGEEVLFGEDQPPALDGVIATTVGTLFHAFGYLAAFVLFFRARSSAAVVGRLRWAYRTVGVDIRDTESVDDIERTTFRCPYRNLGAERYGRRRVCHDVLDRVDDGYVTFLDRHRDIDYRRPRTCTASECCYSEVAER